MADTYRKRKGDPKTQVWPKTTTTAAVEVGDMLKEASGEIAAVAAATDNIAFRAIAATSSAADSSDEVTGWLADGEAEFDFDLDETTTVAIGDEFAISAAQELTKQTTDAIAVATEPGTGVTEARVRFQIPRAIVGDAS